MGAKKILYVEDDAMLSNVFLEEFRDNLHLDVDHVSCLIDAKSLLENNQYTHFILDGTFPRYRNGPVDVLCFELTDTIHKTQNNIHTIIVFTGTPKIAEEAERLGLMGLMKNGEVNLLDVLSADV